MPDAAPRVIGRYEVVKPLGLGVHLARDGERLVALKAMSTPPRSFSHPRIATVFEYLDCGYVAMEYFELGSLRPLLGRLGLAQVAGALEGILTALEHASARGAVHGRLKPENVFIAQDGGVKVAEFGGTGLADTGVALSLETAACMAPEQPQGGALGPWTDLYSVGCLAQALRTGRAPFGETGSPIAILLRHVNDPAPRVQGPLADWIEWLTAKDPADRPQSAREARTALDELLTARMGAKWRREAALVTRPSPTGVTTAGSWQEPVLSGHIPAAPAPPRPPATSPRPAPRRTARRSWTLPAALAGGIAAVLATAGALAADGPAETPGPRTILHSAGLTVELPPGWRLSATGLSGIQDGVTARGPRGATVVIGQADRTAFNRTLLPTALRTAAVGRGRVREGRTLRYDGLAVGGRTAFVRTAATAGGVALLACFAPPRECAAVASTLRVEHALPLGRDERFQAQSARILRWLEKRERTLVAKRDIKRLWWAYLRAAKDLRGLDVAPADRELRRDLAEAIRLAGCAYGRVAGHPERAARESWVVRAEQRNAAAALEGLAAAGYILPPAAADFPRIP